MTTPSHLIVGALRDLAGMELLGLSLRPELPRAVPVTQKRDGMYYLVALRFETTDEAERFQSGLEEFCDGNCDSGMLFLKRPPPITRDECGNCFGIN
jgi:hypothetical protein